MNKILEIKKLAQKLNKASNLYYNTDKTIMTDKKWDLKFDKLKQLEKETNFIITNSPTQKVGYEVKSKLKKVKHSIPLKSLAKTKSINELNKFINNKEVLAMLKGDGLTCELIYNNGKLVQGSTRGNSIIGEDITHNVKTFKNIPLKINFKGYLKLAGEAVIFDDDFITINNKLKDKDKYSHSRNLVAGSVRQLDSRICSSRNVNFMAFSLLECKKNNVDINFNTITEQFNFLSNLGFYIIPYHIIPLYLNELNSVINLLKGNASKLGIPIDGIVFGFNNLEYANSLGETLHHPLNKIAFKFYDNEHETKYIKTQWQVSRTSLINPVGIFEPVNLDGAITTKATLHNIDYFKELQLGKGDTIIVARQNQVIPKILNNKTKSNTEKIPTECPICHSKTKIKLLKTARVLICTNDNCPSKKVSQIEHYCSRDAINIVGLSEATIEKFINKEFIKNIPDIYNLKQYKNKIIDIEGFGTKSYNNLIQSINNSKQCNLSNFIFALGIPNVGLSTAKDLAEYFKTIDNFMNCTKIDLYKIKDIGNVISESIYNYINNQNNINMINELLKYITFNEENINTNQLLQDKIFVITGNVYLYKNRKELQKIIEKLGGKVTGTVSKNTTFLINNDIESNSSKNKKAKKLNIPIITEEQFNKIINK